MGKGGGSAPPPPDYKAAAVATAAGDLEAARAAAAANRVNQVTPYGNLTYTMNPNDVDQWGNAMWTATQSLSPSEQKLLDYQNQTSIGLGELTGTGLDYVKGMMQDPFSTSSLPSLQSSIGNANLQQLSGSANLGMVGQGPELQKSLQDQGMAGWDRASELMMQRLRPQMDIQNENLDAKLASQGIAAGTEAYKRAKQSLGMQQNDLMNQAQLQAQGIGQNLFNQALQGGQFSNTATQQGYQNELAAQAANNPALQQMYSNQQAQQQANNAIAQQIFGNQFTNANLSNAARQQGFNELAYQRNEPLNTLNAVRTGAQVTNPSYVSVPQQATTQGADLLGAATAQGNYDTAAANAAQAGQSSMTSGLMGLAGTAAMAF